MQTPCSVGHQKHRIAPLQNPDCEIGDNRTPCMWRTAHGRLLRAASNEVATETFLAPPLVAAGVWPGSGDLWPNSAQHRSKSARIWSFSEQLWPMSANAAPILAKFTPNAADIVQISSKLGDLGPTPAPMTSQGVWGQARRMACE